MSDSMVEFESNIDKLAASIDRLKIRSEKKTLKIEALEAEVERLQRGIREYAELDSFADGSGYGVIENPDSVIEEFISDKAKTSLWQCSFL